MSKSESQLSVDEDYWNQSDFKGFNFEELDESDEDWDNFKKDVDKLEGSIEAPISPISTSLPVSEIKEEKPPSVSFELPNYDYSELESKMGDLTWELKISRPYSDIEPIEMVRKIALGQKFTLEHFKSQDDKTGLLDAAIRLQDGNAIVVILLFLKKTLKLSIFNQIVMQRPSAAKQYESYLRNHFENRELIDFLCMTGKPLDAAMLSFSLAISSIDQEYRINKIVSCLRSHFNSNPGLAFYSNLILEYVNLLNRQIPIEKEDNKAIKEMRAPAQFEAFPKTATLHNTSLISTLYYCCLYHYYLPEPQLASPMSVKKYFQLSDKQFVWVSLAALTKQQLWSEIESLFKSKSWLGGTKMKCSIGYDRVLDLLHHSEAPIEILSKYLLYIDDKELRLEIAKKYQCTKVTIETLVLLRDRLGLLEQLARTPTENEEYNYGQDALRFPNMKWKN